MATSVYKREEIALQDGTDVTLMPLPIAPLRRFMAAWKAFEDAKTEEDSFDILVNCCGIALEKNYKGKFDTMRASVEEQTNGEFLSPEYKTYLEETLDLETINKIIEVCGGINLNDPKLLELAESLTEDGTN